MKTKDFALEVKALDDSGTFEGYASVFGVRDSFNEVVEPGAFIGSLRKRNTEWPLMLWQHRSDEPIGVWMDLAEDKKGLWAKGRLLQGVQSADEALIRMKAGAVRGMSIGYKEKNVEEPKDRGDPRRLLELELMEISVVSFPANRQSRVELVKHEALDGFALRLKAGEHPPIKDFEEVLRESGFPRALAAQIASVGYAKAIQSESEGTKANAAAIATLRAIVTGHQKAS